MGSQFFKKRLPRYEDGKFPRIPRVRPKTFKTEELAKKYAELKSIKGTVKPKGQKFVILVSSE